MEFALHVLAPSIAKMFFNDNSPKVIPNVAEVKNNDNPTFDLPPMLTVKEAVEFLRVSKSVVYEMCRLYHGKYFPYVQIRNRKMIPISCYGITK